MGENFTCLNSTYSKWDCQPYNINVWYQKNPLINKKVKLIKPTIMNIVLKNLASEKKWECCISSVNCRHPRIYGGRHVDSAGHKRYCPNVNEELGETGCLLCIFLLFFLFSNHRALFEMFLKTIAEHYFPFILKNIFALYSLLSIIILQRIPGCPL